MKFQLIIILSIISLLFLACKEPEIPFIPLDEEMEAYFASAGAGSLHIYQDSASSELDTVVIVKKRFGTTITTIILVGDFCYDMNLRKQKISAPISLPMMIAFISRYSMVQGGAIKSSRSMESTAPKDLSPFYPL